MASYIKINGVEVPYPKRGLTPTVTTVVDAGRNLNGVVVGQRIGRDQYKLDNLEWPYLSAEEWSRILQLIKGFYFDCTFPDPVTNNWITLRMYCGDRTAEPYWIKRDAQGNPIGKPSHYINCKVNIIDTGR